MTILVPARAVTAPELDAVDAVVGAEVEGAAHGVIPEEVVRAGPGVMSLTILVPPRVPSLRQSSTVLAVVGGEVEGAADVGELPRHLPDLEARSGSPG